MPRLRPVARQVILTRRTVEELAADGHIEVTDQQWVETLETVGVPMYLAWEANAPVGELGARIMVRGWADRLVREWPIALRKVPQFSQVLRVALALDDNDAAERIVGAALAALQLDGASGVTVLLRKGFQ